MKIGVFDSGLGGITVLKKLIEVYPKNEYIYYADLKNMPYGLKTQEQLNKIATNILEKLEKQNVDMYVCACGTLSSVAMDNMKQYLKNESKTIIGIIDPIIDDIKKYDSQNILLIATDATIRKAVIENKIKEACPNSVVYAKACPEFVEAIENHSDDEKMLLELTRKYLSDYNKKIDIVVCGCTHYILYQKYIKKVLENVNIIEAGTAIANYLRYINERCSLKDNNENKTSINIIVSKKTKDFKNNVKRILGTNKFNIYYRD